MKVSPTCPTCKKTSVLDNNPFWPFCSQHCKLIDLGHWIQGDYKIPAEPADEEEMEEE